MAFVTLVAPLTSTGTPNAYTLGSRHADKDGKEYIYLAGVASTAAGDWVSYGSTYATTRLTGSPIAPVAVAMSASTAAGYGWYQRYGVCSTAKITAVAAVNTRLYLSAITAAATDTYVAGSTIVGAFSQMVYSGTTSSGVVYLNYPYMVSTVL